MKKTMILVLIMIFCFSGGAVYAYNGNEYLEDYDVVLGSLDEDYEILNQDLVDRDKLEIDSKIKKQLSSISNDYLKDFINKFNNYSDIITFFYNEDDGMIHANFKISNQRNSLSSNYLSHSSDFKEDYGELTLIVNDFMNFENYYRQFNSPTLYRDQKGCKVEEYEAIDKTNFDSLMRISGTQLIRDYFSSRNYTVSLAFFNHSLLDNPSNLRYQTEGGNKGPIVTALKDGLYENGFVRQVARFGYEGNNESNIDGQYIKDNYFSEFNSGDLKYAIHGLHNIRFHRMYYGRTYFRFFDVYDFNRYLSFILNLTTSGTTPYNITVEGLVINDWLQ
ncbi:MAG: hypothetical protein SOR77_05060 [Peptoniphilus sp.]|uniref:hypothetical protein n=1 Tax=Peptoniphilus sp. TaxID=1971214 RepID=UPI002A7639DD|nr:hypothetical protein [Peptoniphilus sp.]MDY2986989.1 hypothetical protein [Peptoniphilus sp.]